MQYVTFLKVQTEEDEDDKRKLIFVVEDEKPVRKLAPLLNFYMFMFTEALSVQKSLILSLLQDLVNFIRRVYPEFSQQLQLNITSHAFDGESSKFRKFVSNLILIQTIDKMT